MKNLLVATKNILKSALKKFFSRPLNVFLFLVGVGLLSILGGMYYIYLLSLELPTVSEISNFKYAEPLVVYDSAGNVIAEIGHERRYPIAFDKIPLQIKQAVVAVEDARFYEHRGVDLMGIARAFVKNVRAGRVVEGGSTLTQQLVKIIYLTPEKKIKRKLKEAILAYRIDNYLTKNEILELYLNQVNFGRGAYGVQAAAINYFGKDASELTLEECALIAGMPKAPSFYAPHINVGRATARRNHVLFRMYEVGYITEDEYKEAIQIPIKIVDNIPLKLKYAGYFLDFIKNYLEETLKIKTDTASGLKIYTTLRLDYQLQAEQAVRDNIIAVSKREGFAGAVGYYEENGYTPIPVVNEDYAEADLENFEISKNNSSLLDTPPYLAKLGYIKVRVTDVKQDKVMILDSRGVDGYLELKANEWAKPVGAELDKLQDFRTILKADDIIYVSQDQNNKDIYYLEQDPQIEGALVSVNPVTGEIYAMVGGFSYEKSFFNRAVQAKRQMGSTFKPIVYSVAFESGFWTMDEIIDAPIIAEENNGEKVWKPKNYEDKFHGATTLKEALLKSRNVVTVKLAEKIGIKRIIQYARNYGITTDLPNDLSISIGSASAPIIEVAYAYCVFANHGSRPASPYFITKIEDIDGNVLYEFSKPEQFLVLEEAAADMMTQTMVDIVEMGGSWRAKAIRRTVGGKTGTTNDSKDAWFAGFLPNLVSVAWVGYDDFRKLGDYATGSSAASPQWVNYMSGILASIPFETFKFSDKTAYFKVDKETHKITNSLSGDYSFEIFPVDENGSPMRIYRQLQ